jgi:hypothetical protein
MPPCRGCVPVIILADTLPTTVRADFTSEMPSGINLELHDSLRAPRKEKIPLGTDDDAPSGDEPQE